MTNTLGTLLIPVQPDKTDELQAVPFEQFLSSHPPGQLASVSAQYRRNTNYRDRIEIAAPSVFVHCDSPECSGPHYYDTDDYLCGNSEQPIHGFLSYICRHCKTSKRVYAVRAQVRPELNKPVDMVKLGEFPAFGPKTPAKLMSLVGSERDYFLKGRRAESQGMGIAAFAYYRRVVETKKFEILDSIINVCRRVNAPLEMVEAIERAQKETQFKNAIEAIKDGIPESLFIDGHNPLSLLHVALSDGLHNESDEECLARATTIRTALAALVERVATVLKEEKELSEAIARLAQSKK